VLDNSSEQTETISKFFQRFDKFAETNKSVESDSVEDGVDGDLAESEEDSFETKAIFTLADFLKELKPNEYYDIAQKLFLSWGSAHSPLN